MRTLRRDPRPDHYAIAHVALRRLALDDPLGYLLVMASQDAQVRVQSLVDAVRRRQTVVAGEPTFSREDIAIHCTGVGRFPCAIVEMPPPVAEAEAYFTALVVLSDLTTFTPFNELSVRARYFTLEYGTFPEGYTRTVFCEWGADGAHSNYGDGPEATVAGFVRAIAKVCGVQQA